MKNLPKRVTILFIIVSLICIGLFSTFLFLRQQPGEEAEIPIKVTSEIPQISVSLKNKERLLAFLKKREFFEKGAIVYGENFQWVKPERLLIILTPQVQKHVWVIGPEEEEPYRSFGVQYQNGEYRLLLHWASVIWQKGEEEWLAGELTGDLVRALLRVTKAPDIAVVEFLSEEEEMLLEDFSKEAVFSIEKKQNQSWLKKLEKLLVAEVWAACGGSYDCGWWSYNCYCPGTPDDNWKCKLPTDKCGPGGYTLCSCTSHCGPETSHSGPCYGTNEFQCKNPCTDEDCVINNLCYWSTPTPTPTGGGPTSTPAPTSTPVPSCTVDLTPNTATVQTGSASTLTAAVTWNGTVTQVNFLSGNTSIVTVNPASDTTVVYSTQASGVSVGSTTVRADVIMSGASRCNDTSTVNVIVAGPWWQVKDADVTTNGNLISPIPGTCTLPACNPVLGLKGTGGFPGVPAYGGATADFQAGAGTGRAAEDPYNWLAASRYNGRTYDYAFFERQIPDDVVINELTPPVTGGTFNSGGTPSRGYVWYHWNGATLGDLTIGGNVNLVGSRRVVLMAEGANVTINGRIQLQNPGQGFFMMVVGKDTNGLKGDILVDPSVDDIEGIFLAESEFKTGVASSQFNARGSVVAYEGISLERDLGASNANTPAEVFEYAPDIIATFPKVFTQRRIRWKEVAP